jgi:hypothetical protein
MRKASKYNQNPLHEFRREPGEAQPELIYATVRVRRIAVSVIFVVNMILAVGLILVADTPGCKSRGA